MDSTALTKHHPRTTDPFTMRGGLHPFAQKSSLSLTLKKLNEIYPFHLSIVSLSVQVETPARGQHTEMFLCFCVTADAETTKCNEKRPWNSNQWDLTLDFSS